MLHATTTKNRLGNELMYSLELGNYLTRKLYLAPTVGISGRRAAGVTNTIIISVTHLSTIITFNQSVHGVMRSAK